MDEKEGRDGCLGRVRGMKPSFNRIHVRMYASFPGPIDH